MNTNETPVTESPENKSIPVRIREYWTPYRIASAIFFMLFAGADVSLYLFGKSATGNIFIALILTLLSGVGALVWKYQRDHANSNETQRSIALWMIVLHAITAVIFMGGNFSRGGWEVLAEQIKINGSLAKDLIDYQVLIEKIFTWSIVIALSSDLVALFFFMENDTEKKQARVLAQLDRDNKDAKLAAEVRTGQIARTEYARYSHSFSELQGLVYARDRLIKEYEGKLDDDTLIKMLASTNERIAEITGAISIPAIPANSANAPFSQPSQVKK